MRKEKIAWQKKLNTRASERISQRAIECNNLQWGRMVDYNLPTLKEWGLQEVRAELRYNQIVDTIKRVYWWLRLQPMLREWGWE